MPGQVVLAKTILNVTDALVDPSSFQTVWEAAAAGTSVDQTYVVDQINDFLNTAGSGFNAMGKYLSPVVQRGSAVHRIELYDITAHLDGSPHGSPINIYGQGLTPTGTANASLDGGACAISFRSDYGFDVEFAPGARPRSRDRNRFYFGPLDYGALTRNATNRCTINAAFIADAGHCFSRLVATGHVAGSDTTMVQWSRKNAAIKPIVEASVDDRPDYQRRRSDPGNITVIYHI